MSDQFYKSGGFWSGVSLYYVILWIFSFYPAFIISIAVQRSVFGIEGGEGVEMLGLLVMTIGTFIILGLTVVKQYFIVLMIYLVTAWPFFYILKHCCNAEEWRDGVWITTYPLPLDWWPLW